MDHFSTEDIRFRGLVSKLGEENAKKLTCALSKSDNYTSFLDRSLQANNSFSKVLKNCPTISRSKKQCKLWRKIMVDTMIIKNKINK